MSVLRLVALLALVATPAAADPDTDDKPAASVVSTELDRDDLDERPHVRPQDLLRHVPGLVALGHGGSAMQLLARGFDAAQGGDLSVNVDGVPVNLGSHAYAHGYADTQFVIPDAVATIRLREGDYAARDDAFASAGTLDVTTIDEVPHGVAVRITSGTELTNPFLRQRLRRLRYRLTGMFSPELERGSALLAAEVGIDDGPDVHPQRFRRGAMLGKLRRPIGDDGELRVAVQFYEGRWFDSGFLPASEIAAGHLTLFSAADPTQGGIAQRASASVAYEAHDRRGATWHLTAYVVDSDLRLYDNPTLFARDTDDGGELEYVDQRVYYGLDGFYRRAHRIAGRPALLRVGMQARSDRADTATWHDERRNRLATCFGAMNPCTDTTPSVREVAVYAEDKVRIARRLQGELGVRLGEYTFDVDDRDVDTMLGAATLGGTGARARISPKLSLAYTGDDLTLSLLGGAGARATDARAAVAQSGYGAFARTYSAETGALVHPAKELSAAVALWTSWLEAHAVWLADAGAAVQAPASRRDGVEARLAFAPSRWLSFDGSLGVARGVELPDGGDLVLAPRLAALAGVAVHDARGFVSARLRALGPRATIDPAFPTRGLALLDLVARYKRRSFELDFTIENLFDTRWYESQLAGDVRPSRRVDTLRDLLVTPGVPLTATISLGYVP